MHKFEEITPYEFKEEQKRASIIYLSTGPLEFHEECNALGVDAFKGYDWCLAAAERTGGIVFPAMPLGVKCGLPRFEGDNNYLERDEIRDIMTGAVKLHGRFGGPGLFTSFTLCKNIFKELLQNFAEDLNFKLCVFVGTHGPNGTLCNEIVAECGGTVSGMKVMPVRTLQYNLDVIQEYYKKKNIQRISHGGLWEAAFNYAMNPDFFHPEYLDASKYPQTYGPLTEEFYEGCIRPVISEYRQMTPEFAKKLRETTIERMAADVLKVYRSIADGSRQEL